MYEFFEFYTDFCCLLQAGEMAHKAHIKEAMFSTNRKDWEVQIMSVHARKDAIVHHTERMTGTFVSFVGFYNFLLT